MSYLLNYYSNNEQTHSEIWMDSGPGQHKGGGYLFVSLGINYHYSLIVR